MCYFEGCKERGPPRPPEPRLGGLTGKGKDARQTELKSPMSIFLESGNYRKCAIMEVLGPFQEEILQETIEGKNTDSKLKGIMEVS